MTIARPLAVAAVLSTCLSGQACTPVVYELASAGEDGHATRTSGTDTPVEPTTGDTTGPPDPTPPQPGETSESGTTDPPPACDDGALNGGETDIDCGGPCKPCPPGQACDSPRDCELGLCLDGVCSKPVCFGPKDCPPPGPCLIGVCGPGGQCIAEPDLDGTPCEDGDLCTPKDICLGGKCAPTDKLDCSKFDGPCRTGLCNPQTGGCVVEWPSEGEPCDDGLECTFGELCSLGECVALLPPPKPLLATDFSVLGGWKAEPPWQIGPAAGSACSAKQAEDPAVDHTMMTADNHVAGAAIGGCLPVDAFPPACLVSPVIDALVPGELWLRYFAILNTADAPMESSVEVFNGKEWVALVVIDSFVAEFDWTEHAHDLTPFKGPELRVRFCHRSNGPSISVAGWSIDDLAVGPPVCAP